MAKTKRCTDSTMAGLQHWFTHLFEQLGWMVLAQKYGYTDKIKVYKKSIERMQCSLEKKMKTMQNEDDKRDLKIMHENIRLLQEHVNKDF